MVIFCILQPLIMEITSHLIESKISRQFSERISCLQQNSCILLRSQVTKIVAKPIPVYCRIIQFMHIKNCSNFEQKQGPTFRLFFYFSTVSLAKQCQEISNQLYGMWKQKAIKGALELLNSAHRTLLAYILSNTSDSSIHPVYSYSIQQAESTSV